MKNWFQHIIKGSEYQGLEVFERDNIIYYALLKVKKGKGELHVSFEKVFEELDELRVHINKNHALLLTINTARVLKKQIPKNNESNPEQLVVNAFPDLDLENFYYEILDSKESQIVSIGKKEHIDQILSKFRAIGVEPSKISLGVSSLQNSISYLKDSNVVGSNYQLKDWNGSGFKLEPSDFEQGGSIELNGLAISATSLLPFSSILGYLASSEEENNIIDLNQQLLNGFWNRRFFDVGLKSGLGILLTALLLNFLLFSHYRSKVQSLETVSSSEQQLETLKTVKAKVTLKEDRLNRLLGARNSRSTFYLDRIANTLPSSVQLDLMEYQPLLKPIRDEKPIELDESKIQISGFSGDRSAFTLWTEELEQKDWIGSVEIKSYEYADQNSDKFSLKIQFDEVEQ